MKRIGFLIVITLCFINMQCDEDDGVVGFDDSCDEQVIVDKDLYDSIVSDDFQVSNVEIVDDCLNIQVSASGCSGDTWEYKLVDSGAIAESSPEQRFLKFQLINKEICLAFVGQNVSFNLEALQIEGSNTIILNIEGFDEAVTYSY